MIVLKPGVKLTDLYPQMVLGAIVVDGIMCHGMGATYECVITSANDGKHSIISWHYKGRALDFRTKTYTGDLEMLVQTAKRALGPDFDVVLEDIGGENEHLHVEYDPK